MSTPIHNYLDIDVPRNLSTSQIKTHRDAAKERSRCARRDWTLQGTDAAWDILTATDAYLQRFNEIYPEPVMNWYHYKRARKVAPKTVVRLKPGETF